jgi:hypothetical protein
VDWEGLLHFKVVQLRIYLGQFKGRVGRMVKAFEEGVQNMTFEDIDAAQDELDEVMTRYSETHQAYGAIAPEKDRQDISSSYFEMGQRV